MAAPTYNDVYQYGKQVQGVSQEARNAFLKAAESVDFSDWSVAVEQLREIIDGIVDYYGMAASELGAQWYEYCRSMKYDSRYTAIVGQTSRYSLRSDCDAVIDKLFDGKIEPEDMVMSLAGVVTDQVQKHSRDTILDNLDIEYKAARNRGDDAMADSIGYARVPRGDACAFCLMMASRGFVYTSKYTAENKKGGGKYHEHCTCEAVPFHEAGTIKGYGRKLSQYQDMYYEAEHVYRSNSKPQELKDRISEARKEHNERYKRGELAEPWNQDNEVTLIMRYQHPELH